jgi:hypothetical protein
MKKIIITFFALVIILLAILFVSEALFNKNLIEQIPTPIEDVLPIVDIKEQYKDSTYTFVGSVDLPTPCHSVEAKVNQISDPLYEIEVTILPPAPDVMCAQVITPRQYSVSFQAPEEITVFANINGVIHELSRFVVPEGENINTFELYIKG